VDHERKKKEITPFVTGPPRKRQREGRLELLPGGRFGQERSADLLGRTGKEFWSGRICSTPRPTEQGGGKKKKKKKGKEMREMYFLPHWRRFYIRNLKCGGGGGGGGRGEGGGGGGPFLFILILTLVRRPNHIGGKRKVGSSPV